MYTYFDQTKKVLCVIQIIEETNAAAETQNTVMGHKDTEVIDTALNDSTASKLTVTLTTPPAFNTPATAEITEGTATITLDTLPVFSVDVVSYALSGNTATTAGSQTATVTYSVDTTKLNTYNTDHGTNYTESDVVLPAATTLEWTATEG